MLDTIPIAFIKALCRLLARVSVFQTIMGLLAEHVQVSRKLIMFNIVCNKSSEDMHYYIPAKGCKRMVQGENFVVDNQNG